MHAFKGARMLGDGAWARHISAIDVEPAPHPSLPRMWERVREEGRRKPYFDGFATPML
jgi:hypothetical protein